MEGRGTGGQGRDQSGRIVHYWREAGELRVSDWVRLISAADCPPGQGRECVAGDRIIAVYNVDGEFHAIDGICPHQGGPLGKGRLQGTVVTCPWHGWQFDVCTGKHQTSKTLTHPTFPVKVADGDVWVDLDE